VREPTGLRDYVNRTPHNPDANPDSVGYSGVRSSPACGPAFYPQISKQNSEIPGTYLSDPSRMECVKIKTDMRWER